MDKHIVAAVDAPERSLDSLELAKLMSRTMGAPVDIVTVFPYLPGADPSGEGLTRVREEAGVILRKLADASGLEPLRVEVIPGNFPTRELQRLSEQEPTGLIVVASTNRGTVGRVLPGAVGERLLTGSACPVAIAPRGYAERPVADLKSVGGCFRRLRRGPRCARDGTCACPGGWCTAPCHQRLRTNDLRGARNGTHRRRLR